MMLRALSANPVVVQHPQRQLAYPCGRDVCPTVHQVILPYQRHIHEAVTVAVVVHLTVFEMEKSRCR